MKDWKTTLAGLIGGGLNLFANGMTWKQVLVSIAMTGLGIVAKDSGK